MVFGAYVQNWNQVLTKEQGHVPDCPDMSHLLCPWAAQWLFPKTPYSVLSTPQTPEKSYNVDFLVDS